MSEYVRIKKVSAYPIGVKLTNKIGQIFDGKIVRLMVRGCIVDTVASFVHVGHSYDFSFELPVSRVAVTGHLKSIRTFDQMMSVSEITASEKAKEAAGADDPGRKVVRLAEMHFVGLADHNQTCILEFLTKMGQKEK